MAALMRQVVWVVCLVALSRGALAQLPQPPQPVKPQTAAEMATALVGIPAQVAGWALTGPPVTWEPPTVAADLELAAALQDSRLVWGATASLRDPSGQAVVAIDILRMASALEAFGVSARLRGTQSGPVDLDPEARWAQRRLVLWRGDMVLIATVETASAGVPPEVLAVAPEVVELLPVAGRQPLLMRLIPRARLLPGTLSYHRTGWPPLPLLTNAVAGQYTGEVGGAMLALADLQTPAAAATTYRRLIADLDTGGERWDIATLAAEVELVRSHDHGLCFVMHEDQYVVAAIEVHDRRLVEALLRIALTNIHIQTP